MSHTTPIAVTSMDALNCRLEIQDSMIRSFSKEFYENIGQLLSLVKIQLSTIDLLNEGIAKQQIQSTSLLVDKTISDLRKIIRQNNPDCLLENGFLPEINREVARINESGYGRIIFQLSGKIYRLHADREIILFCALKSLLNDFALNDPHPLAMQICYREGGILIRIDKHLKDEWGKNFSPKADIVKKIRSIKGSIHGMYINDMYKLSMYIKKRDD